MSLPRMEKRELAGALLRAAAGFTLVELLLVLTLVAILAAFAAPRLPLVEFRDRGFAQQALAAIDFARELAISSGCQVQVTLDGSGCRLLWQACGAASGASVVNPTSGQTNFCTESAPSAAPFANFVFDRIGRPSAGQSIAIGARTISVEPETGFARAS